MRRFLKKFLPDHTAVSNNRWLRPFQDSLLHPRLWHLNRHSAAGAVAAGLACGLIPGPFQMLGAACCALIFRINLPLAMLVTLYTNPFTIVPLYLLAYQVGRVVSSDGSGFLAPPEMTPSDMAAWGQALALWIEAVSRPLWIGLILLGAGLALFGYVAVKTAWRLHLMAAWRRRKLRS